MLIMWESQQMCNAQQLQVITVTGQVMMIWRLRLYYRTKLWTKCKWIQWEIGLLSWLKSWHSDLREGLLVELQWRVTSTDHTCRSGHVTGVKGVTWPGIGWVGAFTSVNCTALVLCEWRVNKGCVYIYISVVYIYRPIADPQQVLLQLFLCG